MERPKMPTPPDDGLGFRSSQTEDAWSSRIRRLSLLAGAALVGLAGPANAGGVQTLTTGGQTLEEIIVTAPRVGLVGQADSATEGTILPEQLMARPAYRVGELLETVPGLIVTQHSGEGKANQYFLRGFNLDHGTDIEITLDDMPVNMRTHAHGQGYSDLNFFIPELSSGIQYRKGTYSAEEGEFATAGAVHIGMVDTLAHDLLSISAGTLGDQRIFGAMSRPVADGNLLIAGEFAHLDGPFKIPDNFRKGNAVLRYSEGTPDDGFSLTGMYLIDTFHASNQIPLRAVKDGQIDQFGFIEPSDGGDTERYSFSGKYAQPLGGGELKANAYVIGYNFRLFNDFDYSLDFPAPINDQFKQQDHRHIYGGNVRYVETGSLFGLDSETTFGVQARLDDAHITLARTTLQVQRFVVREDYVTELSGGFFAENATKWTDWFRTVAGIREDLFYTTDSNSSGVPNLNGIDVDALSHALNSGTTGKGQVSPKLEVIFGPWEATEFYGSAGRGYHSDDARGAITQLDALGTYKNLFAGSALIANQSKTPLLTSAVGAEVGIRTGIVPHLQLSAALFQLDLDSELTFSGDAANTSAGRPSRRQGVELSAFYTPLSWLTFDGDAAFSRARFTQEDDGTADTIAGHPGSYIPGSPKIVASAALSVDHLGPWEGALEYRYFGPRALLEEGSVRSGPTILFNARIGYKITENFTLQVDIFNLFDSHAHQIDYYYTSQLANEAQPVNDIHFHPVEPRSARFTLRGEF
jgi:outer membrane receptor protein involved in Fe transport